MLHYKLLSSSIHVNPSNRSRHLSFIIQCDHSKVTSIHEYANRPATGAPAVVKRYR